MRHAEEKLHVGVIGVLYHVIYDFLTEFFYYYHSQSSVLAIIVLVGTVSAEFRVVMDIVAFI